MRTARRLRSPPSSETRWSYHTLYSHDNMNWKPGLSGIRSLHSMSSEELGHTRQCRFVKNIHFYLPVDSKKNSCRHGKKQWFVIISMNLFKSRCSVWIRGQVLVTVDVISGLMEFSQIHMTSSRFTLSQSTSQDPWKIYCLWIPYNVNKNTPLLKRLLMEVEKNPQK